MADPFITISNSMHINSYEALGGLPGLVTFWLRKPGTSLNILDSGFRRNDKRENNYEAIHISRLNWHKKERV